MIHPLLLTFLAISAVHAIQCLDENQQPVDWWFIYKMNNDLQYAYYDASTPAPSGGLEVNGKTLNISTNSLGSTMQQVINQRPSLAVLLYNDEPVTVEAARIEIEAEAAGWDRFRDGPLEALQANLSSGSGTSGHSKGVLAVNNQGGFWLIHSVPIFPQLDGMTTFSWVTSVTYGQSMLCISIDASQVETVAKQISYIDPNFYGSVVPSALGKQYPTLVALLAGSRATGANSASIQSLNGAIKVEHFGKTGSTDKDLYEDVVQPFYQVGFLWETWRRSPYMSSYCTPTYAFDSINVNKLSFGGTPVHSFSYTQDHCKWGISINSTSDTIVCVGDNNRMQSQWPRGGGTGCINVPTLHKAMLAMVTAADTCP